MPPNTSQVSFRSRRITKCRRIIFATSFVFARARAPLCAPRLCAHGSALGFVGLAFPGLGFEDLASPGLGFEVLAFPGLGFEDLASPGLGFEDLASPGLGFEDVDYSTL